MKPILSEDHHMTTSMLQQRNLNVLTCAVFSCKMCTNQIKNSLHSYSTRKSPISKVVQTKSRFFKLAIFPLLFLFAFSCCAPTVGARTTASHRSPTTTNSTLTTSSHGNDSLSNENPSGFRTLLSSPPRVHRVKRSEKTEHDTKKYQKSRPRKMRRHKTKGKKRRKRKGCKKKSKKCKKPKNNKNKRKKNKDKKESSSWGGTDLDTTIRRMYSKSGNSFHLAVLQNGTVKGEPSHLRSDYC